MTQLETPQKPKGPGINIKLGGIKAKVKELFKFEAEEETKTPFQKESKIKKKEESAKSPLAGGL